MDFDPKKHLAPCKKCGADVAPWELAVATSNGVLRARYECKACDRSWTIARPRPGQIFSLDDLYLIPRCHSMCPEVTGIKDVDRCMLDWPHGGDHWNPDARVEQWGQS